MKKPILIDTNVFIWLTQEPRLLGLAARQLLENSEILISPLSVLEIQIKKAVNKLQLDDDVTELIQKHRLTVLPYSLEQAAAHQIFDDNNRDPFDNALIVCALTEQMSFMTGDRAILELAKQYPWIINARATITNEGSK
jgi:PIN domain nuclease of toxin-antitoxin system